MKSIILPYPPTVNHYWGQRVIAPKGRKPFVQPYIEKAGRRFRADVQSAVLQQWGLFRACSDRVALTIEVHAPDRRKRDLDNTLKAILDALTCAGVWRDDSQVDDLRVVRGAVKKPGKVVVTIEKIVGRVVQLPLLGDAR